MPEKSEMSEPTIRLATPDDAPALLAIYEPYVQKARLPRAASQRKAAFIIIPTYRTAARASMSSCVVAQLVQKRTTV